jgi:uncharacterized membrane protein
MKGEQFLQELKKALSGLPGEESQEIIRDQEEYIRDAVASGRSEEEVVSSLGSPIAFAANLSVEAKIQKAEGAQTLNTQVRGTLNAVFAILALAPLNLIFVFGPFMGLLACNFAGWVVSAAVIIASLACLAVWLIKLITISVGIFAHLSSLFLILGFIGLGVLGLFVMYQVTRIFMKATISYLKWNLSLIRGKA